MKIFEIFFKPQEMPVSDIQQKKGHYTGLRDYYAQKIDFLSQKKMDDYLLKLGTQDIAIDVKGIFEEIGRENYRNRCMKYYKSKMKSVTSELKKIDKIKIKKQT